MARWTEQQVVALAPDDRSVAAARRLAKPGPWSDTGSTDTLLWGKCQGSGSTPYQVSVDLTGPAARCTCPSRKFPCKHGLALLLLWVAGEGTIPDADSPADFADDWMAGRRERGGRGRGAAGGVAPAPPDPVAQAKRLEERLTLMSDGLDDFRRWLGDLARNGLAGARQQPYAYWDDAAARLVDAQVPDLADRVRRMGSAVSARPDWADHLLAEVGRWWCATNAWRGREALDAADLGNLRAFLGWPFTADEARSWPTTSGSWLVLGVHRTEEGRLQEQRTWLRHVDTGEVLVVLDFAAVGGSLGVAKVVGSIVTATVARYPGSGVRRGRFTDDPVAGDVAAVTVPGAATLDDGLGALAAGLAANPFLERIPVAIAGASIVPGRADGDRTNRVVDAPGRALPLDPGFEPWAVLARTGGRPVDLFGELEDGAVRLLTVAVDGELVPV